MTAEKKAKELINKFIPNVYCYLGSGMLTNTYDEDIALMNAKKQSLICVDEILEAVTTIADKKYDYWQEVKQEIEKL